MRQQLRERIRRQIALLRAEEERLRTDQARISALGARINTLVRLDVALGSSAPLDSGELNLLFTEELVRMT